MACAQLSCGSKRPAQRSRRCAPFKTNTSGFAPLEPAVVETDTDAFRGHWVGWHLVSQPALEQPQRALLGGNDHPGPVVGAAVRDARRGRHEAIEPRVFEFQSRAAPGCFDIV